MFGRRPLTFLRHWNREIFYQLDTLGRTELFLRWIKYTFERNVLGDLRINTARSWDRRTMAKPNSENVILWHPVDTTAISRKCAWEMNEKKMMAMLEVFCNESWRKISNQIWTISKEKCVRALSCFGDGQICWRKQCLGASKLSPYLHTQITEFRYWRFPPELCAEQGEGESLKCKCLLLRLVYSTKHSNVILRKKLKLSREDIRESKRLGEGQGGQARRSSVLIQGCLWLQPCYSTRVRCSTSWNGRNMTGLACRIIAPKSRYVPAYLSETARAIS